MSYEHRSFAATIGLAMILLAGSRSAAEIKLMCPAPMRTTIVELVAQFERSSPHKVDVVHTPSSFIIKRVRRRRGGGCHHPDRAGERRA